MIGKVIQDIDAAFIDDNIARGRARRVNELEWKAKTSFSSMRVQMNPL